MTTFGYSRLGPGGYPIASHAPAAAAGIIGQVTSANAPQTDAVIGTVEAIAPTGNSGGGGGFGQGAPSSGREFFYSIRGAVRSAQAPQTDQAQGTAPRVDWRKAKKMARKAAIEAARMVPPIIGHVVSAQASGQSRIAGALIHPIIGAVTSSGAAQRSFSVAHAVMVLTARSSSAAGQSRATAVLEHFSDDELLMIRLLLAA